MTSDEKRRDVAKRMRDYDVAEFRESAIVPFLECLGHGYVGWRGILDELADLIDRPTCQMVECAIDHGSSSCGMRCTACGKEFEHVKPGFGWRYCPNCGAVVTEKEGCDVREL